LLQLRHMIRVLLTGGGTGGHIYPLLVVADALSAHQKMQDIRVSYCGPRNRYQEEFRMRDIRMYPILSSKIRRYASFQNIIDIPKFFLSIFQAFITLYRIMPDVVFSKGGPGSLAVVLAARFYLIPVIIHESDSVPGLSNRIAGKMAQRIGVSFPESASYFPEKKTAVVGNPIRDVLTRMISPEAAKTRLRFDSQKPLLVVLGGSQGSAELNEFILRNLKVLLEKIQIFHQCGDGNLKEVREISRIALKELDPSLRSRYRIEGFLGTDEMRDALSAADIVLSRSGSGAIFEIARSGKPAILVPLKGSAREHQRENALSYARSGAALIFERKNLTANVFLMKAEEILSDKDRYESMVRAAEAFSRPDAGKVIAEEIMRLAKAL